MRAATHPDAIDSRLVLRTYGWLALACGTLLVGWGPFWLRASAPPSLPWADAALLRTAAAGLAAAGCCALGFAASDDPRARRLGLFAFAAAHLLFGVVFYAQWNAVLEPIVPRPLAWAPLATGLVLLHLALTGPQADPSYGGGLVSLFGALRKSQKDLRSSYLEQISRAARQEERARLARDLHDAVKQQLFVVQTAAATAQVRLDGDPAAARSAIDQVRTAARDAMSEMQAMLDQLQASPLGNAGLVASIRAQVDALGARTAATVRLEVGPLPPDDALDPGARDAILRVAQEALANIGRHARATSVRLELGLTGTELILLVRDDGQGFDHALAPRGMGLSNMEARAAESGGALTLRSAPGQGTTVRFALPYDPPRPREHVTRAVGWGTILLLHLAVMWARGVRPFSESPLLTAVFVVAIIGIGRHAFAVYRLKHSRLAA